MARDVDRVIHDGRALMAPLRLGDEGKLIPVA
jgi:hypothetical protein